MAFSIDDDGMLMWLNDRSAAATSFAKDFLLEQEGTGNNINGKPKAYTQSGLRTAYAGAAAANFLRVQPGDPRVPDILGIAQYGTVYTGHQAKIAEHGGDNPQDRHVLLVVAGGPITDPGVVSSAVETTQIAPTILSLLGLNPEGPDGCADRAHGSPRPLVGHRAGPATTVDVAGPFWRSPAAGR